MKVVEELADINTLGIVENGIQYTGLLIKFPDGDIVQLRTDHRINEVSIAIQAFFALAEKGAGEA